MGFWGRNKDGNQIPTIASATEIFLPDDVSEAFISGTTAIVRIRPANVIVGRRVTFIGITTTGPAFTNNDDTSTAYQMDLGGSNITIAPNDVLELIQKADGTWLRRFSTNN